MPASLSFKKSATEETANLNEVKIITLEDKTGNKYTLGLEGTGANAELKLKYTPKTGTAIEYTVDGLVKALGAILGATSDSDGKKSILVEKLGGFLASTDEVKYDNAANQTAKDFLAGKFPLVKTDGSNIASLTDKGKALASAILGVEYTDSENKKRSVLVEKLGKSLGDNTNTYKAKYDGSNEQIAKDFLVSKGLGSASASDVADKLITEKATELGTAILGVTKKVNNVDKPVLETDLAANENFQTAVASNSALKTAVTTDMTFKNAVTSTLSRPEAIAAVPALKTDVATQLLTGDNKVALATEIASKTELQTAVAADQGFRGAVASNLARPEAIAAVPALKTAVATQLLSDANKDQLGTAILGVTKKVDNVDKPALETDLAANPGLQTAVKNALASDQNFGKGARIKANAEDPVFQGSVREVMSQPVFEIPADDNAPLSWDW